MRLLKTSLRMPLPRYEPRTKLRKKGGRIGTICDPYFSAMRLRMSFDHGSCVAGFPWKLSEGFCKRSFDSGAQLPVYKRRPLC